MVETWITIKDHPLYSVSNLGMIKNNKTEKVLKPYTVGGKNNQYAVVDLYPIKHVKVHRIVALHFIPNPEEKREVNHKDGDHFNNKVDNLEWVTGSENCFHAYRVLHRKKYIGDENVHSKKVVRVEDGMVFVSLRESARSVGLKGHTSISNALRGKIKTAGGYHWKYVE